MSQFLSALVTDHPLLRSACLYLFYAISLAIAGMLLGSLVRFRQKKAEGVSHFHRHWAVDIFWAIIPMMILVALVLPALLEAAQHG